MDYSQRVRGRMVRLALKELREILRDRRTVITLFLMPILLYPLLSLGFQRFLLTGLAGPGQSEFRIGVASERDGKFAMAMVGYGNQLLEEQASLGDQKYENQSDSNDSEKRGIQEDEDEPLIELHFFPDLEEAVRDYRIDLAIRTDPANPPRWRPNRDIAVNFEFILRENSPAGEQARNYVLKRVRAASQQFLTKRLEALGVQQRAEPFEVTSHLVPNADPGGGRVSLAALIPVILILMTITGAVYPAIDLTAGERERGTMEMLVAAPVPRLGLLFAKYVAVVTVAMLTATVNLAAMTITLFVSGMGETLFGTAGFSTGVLFQIFLLLMLFAAFFSAVLLTLTSFARSFKEAQAYLIPLMLFALSPGLASLIPGLELQGWLLVTPLLNIALLSRDLLSGESNAVATVVVVMSTLLFALAALSTAARLFGSESVLYNTEGNWRDLLRRPKEVRPAASFSSALLCLALMFPACFVANNLIARAGANAGIGTRLVWMSASASLIFAGFPLCAAWLGRVAWATGFRLYRPRIWSLAGAILLGISLWPFALEFTLLMRESGLVTIDSKHLKAVQDVLAETRTLSPWAIVAAFALVPAMTEEWFFRGFLFTAWKPEERPTATVFGSAIIFGLFHLIATDALAFERLLPSTLLGVVLGWICLRTGSLFPGMCLHLCHNGLLILASYYEKHLQAAGWGVADESHIPVSWMVTAFAVSALGAGLIYWANPQGDRDDPDRSLGEFA